MYQVQPLKFLNNHSFAHFRATLKIFRGPAQSQNTIFQRQMLDLGPQTTWRVPIFFSQKSLHPNVEYFINFAHQAVQYVFFPQHLIMQLW